MRTPRPRGRLGWLLAPIAIALLTACQTTTPEPTPTTGRIAGTLSAGSTANHLVAPRPASASTEAAPATSAASPRSVRAGEVIVRFHDDALATASMTTLSVDGVRLEAVRDLALPGARLYRAPGLDAAATIALAR
ncbi:MAG TPA: hypothetical protein VLA56_09825, partial [Pseudomonadales bacterium]|nr:hypothetical protein [Pseudomonadales bacterium]